ncbi:MAG: prepilin-type N-terminal cleavage/methylation domain-containing protein [Gammaproteobacteria bacterium]|nr:prepilin-type N-terminal cleavage/methylation domain-containing protein [Gammaproteobacteria bacterium]
MAADLPYVRGVRGFTLLEVLTAMAIFFMVSGILVSGVAQAIRVAEVGGVEAARTRDQYMRLAWFRETIALTVLPPNDLTQLDPPPPLEGDLRQVSGLSIQTFRSNSNAPSQYRFEIKFDPERGESGLFMTMTATTAITDEIQQSLPLSTWAGSEGRFRYLDENNEWHDRWPSVERQVKAKSYSQSDLPKAVEIRYGGNRDVAPNSVVAAIQDRALPLPTLRELMQ